MKKLFFILLFIPTFLFSQAPPIQWQNTIGGDSTDVLQVIKQTNDGGTIIGGASFSNISGDKTENCEGNLDYWIVKINDVGNIEWQNTLGGNNFDIPYSIDETFDNGFIIGGYSKSNISGDKTDSSRGGSDYWVLKLDSIGNIEWQKTIGGNFPDELFSLEQTLDGGYILGGTSSSDSSGEKTENRRGASDYWMVKLNAAGTIEWQRTIGGSGFERLFTITQTTDGGYFLGGGSQSNISGEKSENCKGGDDFWVLKTDSVGIIQWQKTMGGNSGDNLLTSQQTTDGGYLLGGYSYSNISGDKTENSRGLEDYWIVKLSGSGVLQWQKTIGGSGDDVLQSIIQTTDSGYLLGGNSNSPVSGEKTDAPHDIYWDYWVVKTDSLGNILWQKTIGGDQYDLLYSVYQSNDGGYVLGGQSFSPISFEKTENCISSGAGLCYFDYWIVKLSAPVGLAENNINFPLNIFPNPTQDNCTIKATTFTNAVLKVYDIAGRVVLQQPFNAQAQLNTSLLTQGIYIAEVKDECGKSVKGKLVKE